MIHNYFHNVLEVLGIFLLAEGFSSSSSSTFCSGFVAPSYPVERAVFRDDQLRIVDNDHPVSSFSFTRNFARTSLFASSSSSDGTNDDDVDVEDQYENICAAVIVPGFLTGADEFGPLCKALKERGIPTVAVPMPNWHWLPCLGGRSARPILERIDYTVKHLIAHYEGVNGNNNDDEIYIPPYEYSLLDLYKDFRENPGGALEVGGSSRVDDYPVVEPRGRFSPPPSSSSTTTPKKKVVLIGHSAGGWISRVYLSSSNYGGKSYDGSKYIHSLVTLGAPHADAPGPAFDGISWINKAENERERRKHPRKGGVRSLSVAGTGFKGGDWGSLTKGAYSFCCPDGSDGLSYDGDGVTPIFSALLMPGSDSLVVENVTHFCWSDVFGGSLVAPELTEDHKNGKNWYGSNEIIDQWSKFIIDGSLDQS